MDSGVERDPGLTTTSRTPQRVNSSMNAPKNRAVTCGSAIVIRNSSPGALPSDAPGNPYRHARSGSRYAVAPPGETNADSTVCNFKPISSYSLAASLPTTMPHPA